MTYLKTEKLADYSLGQKIYERQDGSSLYFAKSKKGKEFIIRVRKDDGKTLKSIFSNEMASLNKPSKLKRYVLPIYSMFSENGNNYIVYKNPVDPELDNIMSSVNFDGEEDEEKIKALVSQYFILIRKLNKQQIYPIEDSSVENAVIDSNGKLQVLGFENSIPEKKGSKNGIKTKVTKIADENIGLKTSYIKAASFMNYLFTGKSAISENGINIHSKGIQNEDALSLMNECASKSAEELEEFNPFNSDYLKHEPEVECGKDHFTIDDLEFNWEEGIAITVGNLTVSVDPEESSVTISEDNNEVSISGEGVELKGEIDGYDGDFLSTVSINSEGIELSSEWKEMKYSPTVTVNSDGFTADYGSRRLAINGDGLNYDGSGEKLVIGENFEYNIEDVKVDFKPFKISSNPISLGLSTDDVTVTLNDGLELAIMKNPQLDVSCNGTVLSLNGDSPISVVIGNSITFDLTKKGFNIDMNGVEVSFESGNFKVDNDVVTMSIGKGGVEFLTYGIPFDMKSMKDKVTFPSFKFEMPEIEIPGIPEIPEIPLPDVGIEKPSLESVGGCCNIY